MKVNTNFARTAKLIQHYMIIALVKIVQFNQILDRQIWAELCLKSGRNRPNVYTECLYQVVQLGLPLIKISVKFRSTICMIFGKNSIKNSHKFQIAFLYRNFQHSAIIKLYLF